MKVIDLLNKIANGEEVPKKITIGKSSYEFEWNGNMYLKRFRNKDGYYDFAKPDYIHILDKEIHIIEDTPKEDKKIEKLSTWYSISDEPTLSGACRYLDYNSEKFYNKINEIIDKVNGE